MVVLLCVLILQVGPAKEVEELIRALGSDAPEERDQATARLKEIGAPAIPALERVAKSGEPELRGRAKELLVHFERQERVRAFRPSTARISVDLRDVPLSEAVVRTLHPLGLTGLTVEDSLKARKVTLKLEKATMWDAVDRLSKAADVHLTPSTGTLGREGSDLLEDGSGQDLLRIEAGGWGSHSDGAVEWSSLHPRLWLSPGVWVSSIRLEDLTLKTAAGKSIDITRDDDLDCRRGEGLFTGAYLGKFLVSPADLKGVQKATLRATAFLRFPRDIERHIAPRLLARVQLGEGYVELTGLTKNGQGTWDVGLGGVMTAERFRVLMSVEDRGGRFLGDLPGMDLHPGTSMGMSTSIRLGTGVPDHLVVFRALGEDEVKVPVLIPLKESD